MKEQNMSLPKAAIDFVNENAEGNGAEDPGRADDLFKIGALDSFALVDFVTVLEEHCGIHVPDVDVNPANFRTIEAIERYVESRRLEQ
jgi:acyl carrier protein